MKITYVIVELELHHDGTPENDDRISGMVNVMGNAVANLPLRPGEKTSIKTSVGAESLFL